MANKKQMIKPPAPWYNPTDEEAVVKKVVAYVRVSTDKQAGDDRFGIDSQKQIIQDYCDEHDMEILHWYVDEGQSGVKEKRPELNELLYGEPVNPPIEAVVVAKSDRVARDIKLYYYFMMLLEKKGMKLISATEEVVNDDSGLGNVYKALMLFVAEQERNNITKRTAGGRSVKAARGGYSGGRAPYGYVVENHSLVIEPREAEIVRLIFWYKYDGYSMRSITRALNLSEVRPRAGGDWAISSVKNIIDNEKMYRGMYRYGNKKWVKGQHEAILRDKDLKKPSWVGCEE